MHIRDEPAAPVSYAQQVINSVRQRLAREREDGATTIQRVWRARLPQQRAAPHEAAVEGGLREQLLRDRRDFQEVRSRAERFAQQQGHARYVQEEEPELEDLGELQSPPDRVETQLALSRIAYLEGRLAQEEELRASAEQDAAGLESTAELLQAALEAAEEELKQQAAQADSELNELRELLVESGTISQDLEQGCRKLQQQTLHWQQKAKAAAAHPPDESKEQITWLKNEVMVARVALEQEQTARFALEEQLAQSSEGRVVEELEAARLETVSYTHLRAHETVLDLVCRLLLEKKKKD
eukprot:TRINITY_DN13614_c0_g2_i1.p1 TRINITY_DN13614_c0_g2~~TRINITY_DN13614_c0_g2_i1.p1  ORF type:complete len:298 (-),score=81.41 TRINITY_DN13614_c0_g2_i1:8-901(-)